MVREWLSMDETSTNRSRAAPLDKRCGGAVLYALQALLRQAHKVSRDFRRPSMMLSDQGNPPVGAGRRLDQQAALAPDRTGDMKQRALQQRFP